MTVTMRVRLLDDGSLLLEWTSEHWNLSLSLEKDAGESGYFYVEDDTLANAREHGSIDVADRKRIVDWVSDWRVEG